MPNFIYDLSSFEMVSLLTAVLVGSAWFGTIFLRPIRASLHPQGSGPPELVGILSFLRENDMKRAECVALELLLGGILGCVLVFGLPAHASAQNRRDDAAQAEGSRLPKPDPAFKGKIGETYKDSTPSYPLPVKAPKGSPNVLLILLDDVGFGMCSTFGGPVPTPNMDKLANNGLKYTRFHTTALCSPTRAALLAGRNHHSCGTGVIIEMGTGYPGYTGIIPRSTALVSQILLDNGYATGMFGKWHNTPEPEISPAGPFDRWPTGLGFEYFYGFNQGETNQYYPALYRNTTPVAAAEVARAGLPLHRGHDRRGDRLDAERAGRRPGQAVVRLLQHVRRSRPAPCPEGMARQVQGKVRPRLGQAAGNDPREATGDGHHPQGHEAHPATEGDSRVGGASRRTPGWSTPA